MIEFDGTLFLQLQKTGGTHVERILESCVPHVKHAKHSIPNAAILARNERVLMGLRSPFSWYLSLWSYGISGRSGFEGRVTQRFSPRNLMLSSYENAELLSRLRFESLKRRSDWKTVYQRGDSPEAFRDWLKLLFIEAKNQCLPDGYRPLRNNGETMGFYTWRLVKMALGPHPKQLNGTRGESSFQIFCQRSVVSHYLRTESLNDDFLRFIEAFHPKHFEEIRDKLERNSISNSSSRKFSAEKYYDENMTALVSSGDHLIFELLQSQTKEVEK